MHCQVVGDVERRGGVAVLWVVLRRALLRLLSIGRQTGRTIPESEHSHAIFDMRKLLAEDRSLSQ